MIGPDFIIAGGHKCATTTLHAVLDQHPQLNMSDPKEPHYLVRQHCEHRLHAGIWTQTDYAQIWQSDRAGLKGESSVLYLPFADELSFRISSELERAPKIIIIVRDPVERAYSSYHDVRLKNPHETTATFAEAVQREIHRGPWRLDGAGSPTLRHLALGIYSEGIRNLRSAVGPENIHVALYDDLQTSPESFLSDLESFLGVTHIPDLTQAIHRKNQGKLVWRSQWISDLARSTLAINSRRMLHRITPRIHASLTKTSTTSLTTRAEPMDPATRHTLESLYASETARLRRLFGPRAGWLRDRAE
jgi:hypothetical protein